MITATRVMGRATGQVRALGDPTAVRELRGEGDHVVWIDVEAPTEADLALVGELFKIHPLTLEDCRHAHQRPKLEVYDGYVQVVLYEFSSTGPAHATAAKELVLLVGPDFMVSVHPAATPLMARVAERWKHVPALADELATFLAYLAIDAAVDTYFPVVEALAERAEGMEDAVMGGRAPDVLGAIFGLKKDMLRVRKLVVPLRDVFMVLMRGPGSHFGTATYPYFQDILDHLMRVGDAIDLHRDLLTSAMDLHMSAVSNRTNDTMKHLTVLSTVLMTSALIAGVYGMNFKYMPELATPYGYYLTLWSMAAVALALVTAFWWWRYIGVSRPGKRPIAAFSLAVAAVAVGTTGMILWKPVLGPPTVTRAEYMSLTSGMGPDDAAAVVGAPGEETTREDAGGVARQVYTWSNADGAWVTATFENGRLQAKAFEKLR